MRNLLTVALLCGLPAVASAQESLPISVEARGAFASPTGEWADEDSIDSGFGFGAALVFDATPAVAVYAGWDRFSFGVDDDGELASNVDADATDSGFRGGVQLTYRADPSLSFEPFLQLGGIFNTTSIEVSGNGASIDLDADAAPGFEIAAGASFDAGAVAIKPTLFYRSHSAEFDALDELGDNETTVGYFGVLLGLAIGG